MVKKMEDGGWRERFLFGYCVHIRVVLELSIIYYLADIYKSASCGLKHIGRS